MDRTTWLSGFRSWLEKCPSSAVAACFPAYRPDLIQVMSDSLGYKLVDFRKERMAPLGWKAAAVPLFELGQSASAAMEDGQPVILQNAESLLAVHEGEARRKTLTELLTRDWPQRLILPLVLYAYELPRGLESVHVFDPASLPEESLLLRLAGLQ